jgi:hypothetical protein
MDTGNRTGWTAPLTAGTRDDAVMSAVTALAGRNHRQESGTRTQKPRFVPTVTSKQRCSHAISADLLAALVRRLASGGAQIGSLWHSLSTPAGGRPEAGGLGPVLSCLCAINGWLATFTQRRVIGYSVGAAATLAGALGLGRA